MELASNYDVSGINMDFTRWPPIADPARHDYSVLTSFIKEVRKSLDGVQARKGRKLALSAHLADEFYTNGNLASQKIDLDAWLAPVCWTSSPWRHVRRSRNTTFPLPNGTECRTTPSQDWGAKGMFPDEDPDLCVYGRGPRPVPR